MPHPKRVSPHVAASVGLAALWAIALSAISIYRHDDFATHGYDLGIFDQTIWGYSHFAVIPNTVKRVPDLLGDHFHPILVLLAPLYWIWNDARVLLVAQAALLAAASLPVYRWAREQLGTSAAFAFQAAFLCFFGVIAGELFDFHEVAVGAFVLSVALYATLTRRTRLLVATVVLGLLVKEDMGLTLAALGVYVCLAQRRVRLGAAIAVASLAWFFLAVELILPALRGKAYQYWPFGSLGGSLAAMLAGLAAAPWRGVTLLFDRWEKVRTLLWTFGSWAFLPLLSPIALIGLPNIVERFWSTPHSRWSTSYQYALPLAPILAFAAIDGLRRVGSRTDARMIRVGAPAVALCAVAATLVIAPFYTRAGLSGPEAAAAEACLDVIPSGTSVAASDLFVPHLSHRDRIYVLVPRTDDQQYVAVARRTWNGRRALAAIARGDVRYATACRNSVITVLRRT